MSLTLLKEIKDGFFSNKRLLKGFLKALLGVFFHFEVGIKTFQQQDRKGQPLEKIRPEMNVEMRCSKYFMVLKGHKMGLSRSPIRFLNGTWHTRQAYCHFH